MIALILAIAATWALLEVVAFVLALVITGLSYARLERRLAKEIRKREQAETLPAMPLGAPLDDQGRPYT